MQNVMSYSDEHPLDTLTLDIYPSGSTMLNMYEDDGLTREYQRGGYAFTTFTCQPTDQYVQVGIGKTEGSYAGKPKSRVYVAQVHHLGLSPDSVTKDGSKMQSHASWLSLSSAEEGWCYDETQRMLFVKCKSQTEITYQISAFGKNLISSADRGNPQRTGFHLEQNYPNPFNLQTTLSYRLESPSYVSLKVYDVLGKEVLALTEGYQSDGWYKVDWNGRNASSQQVGSGVYLYRLSLGVGGSALSRSTDTKRMALLK